MTTARTCDNQPFIARAPMVWVFLADYQRWYDYFLGCDVDGLCERNNISMRRPQADDLFLACCDALIAAQNAAIAAESFEIGSCYILIETTVDADTIRAINIRLLIAPLVFLIAVRFAFVSSSAVITVCWLSPFVVFLASRFLTKKSGKDIHR